MRKVAELIRQPFRASRELQKAIQNLGTEKALRTNAVLFKQGDPAKGVFLVASGKVALTANHGRSKKSFGIAEAGSLLGLPATVRNARYSLTAETVENTKVAFVPRTKVQRLLLSDSKLCLEAVQVLSNEIRALRASV
jgi:CRP-like cAMP-binding protein